MLDLTRLNVSLTKHGAHKIALLLRKYNKDDILNRLSNVEPGINIEDAQARKNLSVNSAGVVPEVWAKAQAAGSESIDALVLIGIIFSHNQLIKAMRTGGTTSFRGVIQKGAVLRGKAFTNFAHTIEELGYSVSHTPSRVAYNLTKLFEIPGLNTLAIELIGLKLKAAGWTSKKLLVDELVGLKFNKVFAISSGQFKNWLTTGDIDAVGDTLEDEGFFLGLDGDQTTQDAFVFKAGHKPKKTGTIDVSASTKGAKAQLVHNEMQTVLNDLLVKRYGEDCVGTEQDAGGTSIDLVVKTESFCWFYEIKVAKSVKACIRQAIPQLLEYAYWRNDSNVADRLYIATRFKLTKDAAAFLKLLNERFKLPLYYEQILLEPVD